MLILTTNAVRTGARSFAWPSWPGLQVFVLLPDAKPEARALAEGNDRIVVEWLQHPKTTASLVHDVLQWLRRRLPDEEGPMLFLDAPIPRNARLPDPEEMSPYDVTSEVGSDGHLHRLAMGSMIATSPLLLDFFKMVDDRGADDATLVELLTDILSWKN